MIDRYNENKIYKDILIERFFDLKGSHKIDKVTDLKNELEYLLYYLEIDEDNASDILELKDLLSIIRFVIKVKYIKNIYDINGIKHARNIIKDLWERLLTKKNENKPWSIREIRYMGIMLGCHTNIDELIELSNYTKQRIEDYYSNNKLIDEEYNTLLIALKTNLVTTLFAYKFNYKFKTSLNDNKKYEDKRELYDSILNSNIDEILKNSIPNKNNVKNLVFAYCKKTILSKEMNYIKNATILIKLYKLYYMVNYLKGSIIKYEKDKMLREAYTDIIILGNIE